MNPAFRVVAHEARVGASDGRKPFDESFWGSLDATINALDNVDARLFVDRMCVLHR